MTSEPVRDPVTDHLLTPRNSALVVIDYQPSQLQAMSSMDRDLLVDNVVSVARLARTFDLPVVLSTVNVASGQGHTLPELKAALPDTVEIDRTTMNAWEDVEFRRAVEATGRKKLIMTALWTEACLTFPTLDALRTEPARAESERTAPRRMAAPTVLLVREPLGSESEPKRHRPGALARSRRSCDDWGFPGCDAADPTRTLDAYHAIVHWRM